ncbi:hypothetical protein E2562_023112 [Oryza meyeriana var. granulata]|uniref:Uncharacterized protein n=1 Tax=Oryza meyeriana var. granulata TaxID=110450 RepID=A0A6G1E2L1_9ORYZ|nr:hypothetical protein E2562_023112 [Oryza meyeriana var. granulata]
MVTPCSRSRPARHRTQPQASGTYRNADHDVAATTVAALIGRSNPVLRHRERWEVREGKAVAGLEWAWRVLGRPCRGRQDAGLVENAGESGSPGAHSDGSSFLQRTQQLCVWDHLAVPSLRISLSMFASRIRGRGGSRGRE